MRPRTPCAPRVRVGRPLFLRSHWRMAGTVFQACAYALLPRGARRSHYGLVSLSLARVRRTRGPRASAWAAWLPHLLPACGTGKNARFAAFCLRKGVSSLCTCVRLWPVPFCRHASLWLRACVRGLVAYERERVCALRRVPGAVNLWFAVRLLRSLCVSASCAFV